ncbi:MAG: hypothetical protein R6W93_15140 [Candidatus Limnocylindrales bacterium]
MTDTLAAWRQAERVLAQGEIGSADYEAARLAAMELRDLYQRLTAQTDLDPAAESPAEEGVERATLKRVRADLDLDLDTTDR